MAWYHDLPSKATGHQPVEIHLQVPQMDHTARMDSHHEQPPIPSPADQHTTRRVWYYRAVEQIITNLPQRTGNLALHQPGSAYGLHVDRLHNKDTPVPQRALLFMVRAVGKKKRHLNKASPVPRPESRNRR